MLDFSNWENAGGSAVVCGDWDGLNEGNWVLGMGVEVVMRLGVVVDGGSGGLMVDFLVGDWDWPMVGVLLDGINIDVIAFESLHI
jgi:hypothetical protein